jgi:hypothetical protein
MTPLELHHDPAAGRILAAFDHRILVFDVARLPSARIRGLAVTTAKRSRLAPELPTVAETGVPDFDVMGMVCVLHSGQDCRG